MGKKLEPKENELYKRVDEVLHYIWDPVGVFDQPDARDEYYSYIPIIFHLLNDNRDSQEIEDKLFQIGLDRMGLTISRDKIKKTVDLIIAYRSIIFSEPT